MISNFKLPFSFDPESLKTDLKQIARSDWIAHFNTGYFEGDWSGVALRSAGGLSHQLYPDPQAKGAITNTAILDRCPKIRALLAAFECPIRSARLLRLGPGSTIREHRDYNLAYEDGEVRLHIPIVTNPKVEFILDGDEIVMQEGECWYLDFNLPHSVKNLGEADRIHLVIDCVVNDWLSNLLCLADQRHGPQQSPESLVEVSSPEEFESFRQYVLRNPDLQERLRKTDDRQSFARLAVRLGAQCGYRFSAANVEEALLAAQQAWNKRWIQ